MIKDSTRLVTPKNSVVTYSGNVIDLFKPDPTLILLEDIAHGLSNICRWNGATKSFYSVAEHSVAVARHVSLGEQLAALFHDAEEAYWGDITRPVKAMLPSKVIEAILNFRQVIFDKYGILPITEQINEADDKEIMWDYENLIKANKWEGWKPKEAKQRWLEAVNFYLKTAKL